MTSALVKICFYPKQVEIFREMMTDTYLEDGTLINKIIGYGGARGGAKSFTGRTIMLLRRIVYPNSTCLIFRKTLPELERSQIIQLFKEHSWLEEYHNKQKNRIELPNGSVIHFGYAETYDDIKKWRGSAFDDIFLDEVTEIPEQWIRFLLSTNRRSSAESKQRVAKALFCGNPGGVGHAYFQRVFIDRDNYMKRENPKHFVFMQSHLWDNYTWINDVPGIPKVSVREYYSWHEDKRKEFALRYAPYVGTLGNLDEYEWLAAVEGIWTTFEGQFFPRFSASIHVCEPFAIPSDWKVIGGLDWGAQTVLEVIAEAPDGTMYITDELYIDDDTIGATMRVQQIKEFLRNIGRPSLQIVADNNILTKDTGDSRNRPLEIFRRHGLWNVRPVNKKGSQDMKFRVLCNTRTKELMYWRKDESGAFLDKPKFQIFRDRASNLLKEIPMLMSDLAHPGDFIHDPKTKQDHAYDAWKYGMMNISAPSEKKEIKELAYVPPMRSVAPLSTGAGSSYAKF